MEPPTGPGCVGPMLKHERMTERKPEQQNGTWRRTRGENMEKNMRGEHGREHRGEHGGEHGG